MMKESDKQQALDCLDELKEQIESGEVVTFYAVTMTPDVGFRSEWFGARTAEEMALASMQLSSRIGSKIFKNTKQEDSDADAPDA